MNKDPKLKLSEHIKQRLVSLYFEDEYDKTNIAYLVMMLDTKVDMIINYLDDIKKYE